MKLNLAFMAESSLQISHGTLSILFFKIELFKREKIEECLNGTRCDNKRNKMAQ